MVFVTRGLRICDEIIFVLFVLDQLAAEAKRANIVLIIILSGR